MVFTKFNNIEFNIDQLLYKLGLFKLEKLFMEKYNNIYLEAENVGVEYMKKVNKNLITDLYSNSKEYDFGNSKETDSPFSTTFKFLDQTAEVSETENNVNPKDCTKIKSVHKNTSLIYFPQNRSKTTKIYRKTNDQVFENNVKVLYKHRNKSYDLKRLTSNIYRFTKNCNKSKVISEKIKYADLAYEKDTSSLFKIVEMKTVIFDKN